MSPYTILLLTPMALSFIAWVRAYHRGDPVGAGLGLSTFGCLVFAAVVAGK